MKRLARIEEVFGILSRQTDQIRRLRLAADDRPSATKDKVRAPRRRARKKR